MRNGSDPSSLGPFSGSRKDTIVFTKKVAPLVGLDGESGPIPA